MVESQRTCKNSKVEALRLFQVSIDHKGHFKIQDIFQDTYILEKIREGSYPYNQFMDRQFKLFSGTYCKVEGVEKS